MKKSGTIIVTVLFLLWHLNFIGCSTDKQGNEIGPLNEAITNFAAKYINVGAVIGVIIRGERHVFVFGSKSLEIDDPPDMNTVFEIGSITKTFTTTILAKMHLEGEVNIEENAQNFHPQQEVVLPSSDGVQITLEHLATHTSGIPRMPDNFEEHQKDPSDPYASFTVKNMYEFLNNCTLDFPVGFRHQYSNCGMGLLGLTLALAHGTSYEELLRQKILLPLGMNHTTLFLTDEQRQNVATGHDRGLNPVSMWTATDCFQGAGFIKSNLADMFLYLEANMGLLASPLSEAIAMTHEKRVATEWNDHCGLGWYTTIIFDGQEIVNHNGGTGGFYAFIGFNKVLQTGVIVLTNSRTNSGTNDALGIGILGILKDY